MHHTTSENAVPRIRLAPFLGPGATLPAGSQSRLAAELIARLKAPPHWLVFATEHRPIDLAMVRRVLYLIGMSGRAPQDEPPRISSTKIRIDPQQAAREAKVTRYSRTPDALALHTDCSNKPVPDHLAAFAMERPDPGGGGESVMLSASDLVRELPAHLVQLLRQPVFPFVGERRYPILHGDGDGLRIRYYRNQIASALAKGQTLSPALTASLDALDRYLESSRRSVRLHMQAETC